ncbi:MAG: hypothetical protein P4L76_08965 [Beijerinckiaceae bacterium]|nr:hypothetical protein [Beijerinckiaceae bacterium]
MKTLALDIENPSPRYTMPIFFFLMVAMAAASVLVSPPQADADSFVYVHIY